MGKAAEDKGRANRGAPRVSQAPVQPPVSSGGSSSSSVSPQSASSGAAAASTPGSAPAPTLRSLQASLQQANAQLGQLPQPVAEDVNYPIVPRGVGGARGSEGPNAWARFAARPLLKALTEERRIENQRIQRRDAETDQIAQEGLDQADDIISRQPKTLIGANRAISAWKEARSKVALLYDNENREVPQGVKKELQRLEDQFKNQIVPGLLDCADDIISQEPKTLIGANRAISAWEEARRNVALVYDNENRAVPEGVKQKLQRFEGMCRQRVIDTSTQVPNTSDEVDALNDWNKHEANDQFYTIKNQPALVSAILSRQLVAERFKLVAGEEFNDVRIKHSHLLTEECKQIVESFRKTKEALRR